MLWCPPTNPGTVRPLRMRWKGQSRRKDGAEGNREIIEHRNDDACLFTSNTRNLENLSELKKNIVSIKRVKTLDRPFEFRSRFEFHDVL